jgi:hypothetical protein
MLISMLLLSCFTCSGEPSALATPSNIWDLVKGGAGATVGSSFSFSSSSPWTVSPFMLIFPSTYKSQNEQKDDNRIYFQNYVKELPLKKNNPQKSKASQMFSLVREARPSVITVCNGL